MLLSASPPPSYGKAKAVLSPPLMGQAKAASSPPTPRLFCPLPLWGLLHPLPLMGNTKAASPPPSYQSCFTPSPYEESQGPLPLMGNTKVKHPRLFLFHPHFCAVWMYHTNTGDCRGSFTPILVIAEALCPISHNFTSLLKSIPKLFEVKCITTCMCYYALYEECVNLHTQNRNMK